MLGDVIELSVVVRDLDAAIERFTRLFKLTVHHRGESKEFGFKNAILPTGIGHIELLQPTDPTKPVGKFPDLAWVHPRDTHGLFVELRKRERYD